MRFGKSRRFCRFPIDNPNKKSTESTELLIRTEKFKNSFPFFRKNPYLCSPFLFRKRIFSLNFSLKARLADVQWVDIQTHG